MSILIENNNPSRVCDQVGNQFTMLLFAPQTSLKLSTSSHHIQTFCAFSLYNNYK